MSSFRRLELVLLDQAECVERPDLLASLTPVERATYDAHRRHPEPIGTKKSRQYWAGRLATKWAVQSATGLPFENIQVGNTPEGPERGRPFVEWVHGPETQRLPGCVSIAHSEDLAGAIYADEPVGLDVELVQDRDESFEAVVLSAQERSDVDRAEDRALEVTLRFAEKEALAKLSGRGLSTPFHELAPRGDIRVQRSVVVVRGRRYGVVLAVATSDGRRSGHD